MTVTIEQRGRVGILMIGRPEVRNALDLETTIELDDAFTAFERDDDIWVMVLTGEGSKAFCAGADIKKSMSQSGPGEAQLRPGVDAPTGRSTSSTDGVPPRGGIMTLVTRAFSKPLIGAINGFALGGGFELMLACDLIVAEQHAMLGLPEVKSGLIAGGGGLIRLARRVPYVVAVEMALTGEPITATAALELGLINRVVDTGHSLEVAVALAEKICTNGPLAVRASKRMIRESISTAEADLWALQAEVFLSIRASEDMVEGVRAFAEKRTPSFVGR